MGSRVRPVSSRPFREHLSPFPSLPSEKNTCLFLGKEKTHHPVSHFSATLEKPFLVSPSYSGGHSPTVTMATPFRVWPRGLRKKKKKSRRLSRGPQEKTRFHREEFESLNYWVGTQAPAFYGICYFWKFALGRFFFFLGKIS